MLLLLGDFCACSGGLHVPGIHDAGIDNAGIAGLPDAETCCSAVLRGVLSRADSMSVARSGHTATSLGNGNILIAGGDDAIVDGSVVGGSAELYDAATGAFTMAGSMSGAKTGHTATLLSNGRVLIAGGNSGADCVTDATGELFDPATGTFVATGTFAATGNPTALQRAAHTATLLPGGQVLIAGGAPSCGVVSFLGFASAELYDAGTGTFTETGGMAEVRLDHTATLLADGRVLVAGGIAGSDVHASAELYDPASGTFTSTGNMTVARHEHTATLLGDGRVLVVGGVGGGNNILDSAELYDPGSGTFAATSSMVSSRVGHTATLLCDGRVLIAGGGDNVNVTALPSAELYDPDTGAFSATSGMVSSRGGHTATQLCNGKVLVAGGVDASGSTLASVELYE